MARVGVLAKFAQAKRQNSNTIFSLSIAKIRL